MSRSVLLVLVLLLSPGAAAARAVSFSDAVREHRSDAARQSETSYWQRIVAEQETGQSCESREPGRLVIRHPPLGDPASSAGRRPCDALVIVEAIREQKPIELENVMIRGVLDLREATAPASQRELRLRGARVPLLQQWLTERRRDHRAPERLAGETRFRAVGVPIAIRSSRLAGIEATAEDPILFTESFDLRGTSIAGPVGVVGAVFMEPVGLEGVELTQGGTFSGTHFDAGVDFSRAHVRGEARFDGATFGARALSRASARARLAETPALFIGTTFAKAATFRDAVFEARADFRKASFAGESELVAARFHRLADFAHATFQAPVDAANAIFEADARFPSAAFDKAVTFRGTEFRGRADFALAAFNDQAATFRDAQLGGALFFPRHLSDVGTALGRVWHSAGYDFRETKFANKARALARADFQVHWVFAAVTVIAAAAGLLVALAMRRPRLIRWSRADGPEIVARITEAAPPAHWLRVWARPASPHERIADGAYAIAAYAVLAVALAANYQTLAGHALDATALWLYPAGALVAWTIAVGAALNPFRRHSTPPTEDEKRQNLPPPMLDYFDPAYHVPRRCDEFVHAFVTRVSTGVLGLAGPRGAGRSALARATLDELSRRHAGTAPILAVTMPSPPAGDLMAFFSVLFRRVGQQVQRELRSRLLPCEPRRAAIEHAADQLIQAPPAITLLPLGAVVVAVLFLLASPWWSPSPTGGPSDWTPWLLIASLGGCAVVYYARVLRLLRIRRALYELPAGRLYVRTEQALERLAYEESTSEEREASLALPRGLSFRGRRARSLKERATTLAAMVDDFARYVAALRHIFHRGVVVHIDDADRAEDIKDVRDLILRLKGTLVGGVLFLVPLPHVVLGRATDGPATAVAGMLDDVIVVPPMRFDEAFQMIARRRFFATDPAAPDGLHARDGLGATMCLLAGGIPKEILRLVRRVSTDRHDWTATSLVALSAAEAREGTRLAVLHSSLTSAAKQCVLDAIERGDDGTSVERAATSAAPAVADVALLDVLRAFDRRRAAIHALRARLDDIKVLEGELVAGLAAGAPIVSLLPAWLVDLHRTFATIQTGMTAEVPA
jgi:hypothetical protein